MLIKIEHGNLRTASAPLPRGSSGYQPEPLGNLPSGRPRPANRRTRAVLGLGLVEYRLPRFFTRPRKIENWEMRDSALWCYLILFFTPLWKNVAKK